jgi:hypothetical protein
MGDFIIPFFAAAFLFPFFARIFLAHAKPGMYLQKVDGEPNGRLHDDLEYLPNSVDLTLIGLVLCVAIGELIAKADLNDMGYRQVEYLVMFCLWMSYMLFWQMRIRLLLEKCRAAEIQGSVSLGKIGSSYVAFFCVVWVLLSLLWDFGLKGTFLALLFAFIVQLLLFVWWMFRPRAV